MDPIVVDALRLGLGLLFGAALVHKLRDGARFRATVAAYGLMPRPLVGTASAAVLAAEGITLLGLATPGWTVAGFAGAAGLLALYAGALAVNLLRGRTAIDCGCVGVAGREEISWWLVGRNVVCAAAALVGTFPSAARERVWVDGLTLVAVTTAFVALHAAADQLVANRPGYRRLRGLA